MLTYLDIDEAKKAVIFELDDVLFPRKDYLLQVYYLFANFLEYTEMVPPAQDLTDFLKTAYEHQGEEGLFERAAEVFGIDYRYKENFERLHLTAQLPLKLLLYKPMFDLMQVLNEHGRQLLVLTEGNPTIQLNKLRHIAWNGLDKVLKIYFHEELLARKFEPIDFLLHDNKLLANDVLYIRSVGKPLKGQAVDCLYAERFLESSVTR